MLLSTRELLRRLGSGQGIAELCDAAGISRGAFDRWWSEELLRRTPNGAGRAVEGLRSRVEIARDACGIPHIFAATDDDLFFGFGYAMAEDRLFQLDYLRRKGLGRLSEVLGEEKLASDQVARTVGLNRIAAAEWHRLERKVQQALESFAAGVNAVIDGSGDRLPIEFGLLDYQPESWTPQDSLAIESEFRWYLTGRFPVIVIPELAKQCLGTGSLYTECIRGESDDESILWPGEYDTGESTRLESVGSVVADPADPQGSNNWVISPSRTASGSPILANDPHIAFEAVSCWYEAHLCGGSYNVAGMAYAGIPAIMVGRNERVAWGITNNICSQRDLYREKTDSQQPGHFLYDDRWEPAQEISETITVRDRGPVELTVRFSRNGPIVNDILPSATRSSEQIALKWLGAYHGGWLTAMLEMDQADTASDFCRALRPWHVPTFNLVVADTDGHIALQSAGRVPIRGNYERAYRDGWDPQQQWQGLLPFEGMPHLTDPTRGWIATANNRVAANDYPYLLSGCWASGWRATRIRQMIESSPQISFDDVRAMQLDSKSLRAESAVPHLLHLLDDQEAAVTASIAPQRFSDLIGYLRAWDFRSEPDAVAPTLFNVFFDEWCRTVARARFAEPIAEFVAAGLAGVAGRLLAGDPIGWFEQEQREEALVASFAATTQRLTTELGADASVWTWGAWHRLSLRHVLSSRGDLSHLLDHGGLAVAGDATTVCNTGYQPDGSANAGASYRMVADLGNSPPVLFASDCQSQSGNPGSHHYADQLENWARGEYHSIPLDPSDARLSATMIQELVPS